MIGRLQQETEPRLSKIIRIGAIMVYGSPRVTGGYFHWLG